MTWLTSPISAPRAASIGSPVSSICRARARGTRWASSSAPPAPATSPRVTSGTPKRADAPATTRSQASRSSNPPASAQPSAAPTRGLRGGVWVMPHRPRPGKEGTSPLRNALRSIPAENVPPAPVSTPARSSVAASSSSTASRIPAATAPFRALRASGRLIVMTCTAPWRSTSTSSLIPSPAASRLRLGLTGIMPGAPRRPARRPLSARSHRRRRPQGSSGIHRR